MLKSASYLIQAALIRAALWLVRRLPLHMRAQILAAGVQLAVRFIPELARRALSNLAHIYPDMTRAQHRKILDQVGRNIGRTLTEILFNADYAPIGAQSPVSGPGLTVLGAAKAEGRGAILVSGHFGQWEAIRHALKARGMEVGAVYRPNNNPYYEPLFRAGIEVGGAPIIPKGPAGNRVMLRHIRSGGMIALLVDQFVQQGEVLSFMGQPAVTTLSPAELALRYELPLVPVFGLRVGRNVEVTLEDPIPPSDPETMMQAFNDRLEAWVRAHPGQWFWLHQRWRPHALRAPIP